MSLIKISNLSFTYPGSYVPIFEDVSFQIDTDWKLGFTGRNGRGKTTFLQLLMGLHEYSGTIHSSTNFEYFPFSVVDSSVLTQAVVDSISTNHPHWRL
ncbi:MAG: ATP-binding cassette domain-containing protein, partial [Erysipelotrichaceae bacterium]